MRIALCQLDIQWENREKNLEKVEEFIAASIDSGTELLFFPEMTLTGFSMEISRTSDLHMETVGFFADLARKYSVAIGFGWVEACGERARNHYTVVAETGKVLSDYVKIHPFSFAGEDRHFYPGHDLASFNFRDEIIAPFICYDLRFPEIFQAASRTATLLVVAANWPGSRNEHWRLLLQARAIENQAYVAGINCVGEKGGLAYTGNTMFVDPEGNIVKELVGSEGLVVANFHSEAVRNYRALFPVKKDRQIDIYQNLLTREMSDYK